MVGCKLQWDGNAAQGLRKFGLLNHIFGIAMELELIECLDLSVSTVIDQIPELGFDDRRPGPAVMYPGPVHQ